MMGWNCNLAWPFEAPWPRVLQSGKSAIVWEECYNLKGEVLQSGVLQCGGRSGIVWREECYSLERVLKSGDRNGTACKEDYNLEG